MKVADGHLNHLGSSLLELSVLLRKGDEGLAQELPVGLRRGRSGSDESKGAEEEACGADHVCSVPGLLLQHGDLVQGIAELARLGKLLSLWQERIYVLGAVEG